MIDHATRCGDSLGIMAGHYGRMWPSLALGKLGAVRSIADDILQRYDQDEHGSYRFHYGIDLRVATLAMRGYQQWLCGCPEQSETASTQAIAYARDLNHTASLAWALTWAGAQPAAMRRDAGAAQELGHELIALPEQQRSPMDLAWARVYAGWAIGKRGQREEGVSLIREGLQYLTKEKANLWRSLHLALLAELYIDGEEFDLAAQTLDEARAHIPRSEERFWEAEIYRLMGELQSLQQPGTEEAHHCFCKAIAIAGELGAKSLELRATASLTRHWKQRNKSNEARALLEPIHNWFTEGFDTPDLKDAKALLEDLSNP